MYFEPLISVKCCPKLHIKQLRNNLHYICLWDRVGWRGGSQLKRGGSRKRGGQDPLTPPLWTRLCLRKINSWHNSVSAWRLILFMLVYLTYSNMQSNGACCIFHYLLCRSWIWIQCPRGVSVWRTDRFAIWQRIWDPDWWWCRWT